MIWVILFFAGSFGVNDPRLGFAILAMAAMVRLLAWLLAGLAAIWNEKAEGR